MNEMSIMMSPMMGFGNMNVPACPPVSALVSPFEYCKIVQDQARPEYASLLHINGWIGFIKVGVNKTLAQCSYDTPFETDIELVWVVDRQVDSKVLAMTSRIVPPTEQFQITLHLDDPCDALVLYQDLVKRDISVLLRVRGHVVEFSKRDMDEMLLEFIQTDRLPDFMSTDLTAPQYVMDTQSNEFVGQVIDDICTITIARQTTAIDLLAALIRPAS